MYVKKINFMNCYCYLKLIKETIATINAINNNRKTLNFDASALEKLLLTKLMVICLVTI